ncbi:MAG: cell wall-binding repeat-containing protein [Anaerosomatales bacterium]|nr:cell wall-binding repeat-containing protein [Anaerosomatales bacterium]
MRRLRFALAFVVAAAAFAAIACSSSRSTAEGSRGLDPAAQAAVDVPAVRLLARFRATQPVDIVSPRDGSGRLFIVEKPGRIRIGRLADNTLVPTPFLDISALVSTGGEQGLLGLAFPPGYGTSTQNFYVDYTDRNGDTVIARYRASSDPDRADAGSASRVLFVDQPYANHNGGQVVFGPDGYLYIGMGDGGSSGDPLGNGQKKNTLLGKMLRIDVESGVTPYRVPSDNPFVGDPAYKPEIWALGVRNPWRFSFDRATGAIYIADVGQNRIEEIDVQPAGVGGRNYGWNYYEGSLPFPVGSAPKPTSGLTFPVYEYSHDQGDDCITGGFVYRGSQHPSWQGRYFFGDFESGRIWSMSTTSHAVALALDTPFLITTFGEGEDGELYLAEFMDGTIYELKDAKQAPSVAMARVGGSDRYATAAAIAQAAFPSGCTTAVVTTGEDFPDALASSALAGAVSGPLLLTKRDSVPAALASALTSLGVRDVIVVGGPGAVSPGVVADLETAGYSVQRVAGDDRYETAAEVARKVANRLGVSYGGEAFVVRGDLFPDALAAAPIAFANGMPILLTRPNAMPASTVAAAADIGVARAWVMGGTGAVSDDAASALSVPWTRIEGRDRYETAAGARSRALQEGWSDGQSLGVASGTTFPDGLAGAAFLGVKRGFVLLTQQDLLPAATRQALIDSQATAASATVFGGTGAVGAQVEQLIRWHLP